MWKQDDDNNNGDSPSRRGKIRDQVAGILPGRQTSDMGKGTERETRESGRQIKEVASPGLESFHHDC